MHRRRGNHGERQGIRGCRDHGRDRLFFWQFLWQFWGLRLCQCNINRLLRLCHSVLWVFRR
ncbi:MAG: hypothetical protein Alpg2KO_21140 [Alphaproteobacteria bacterium]